jgi:hypothetical protein
LEITKILYNASVNIKEVSSKTLSPGVTRVSLTLEIEDEDYYIYERLEARMRFDMPKDLIETRLISMG